MARQSSMDCTSLASENSLPTNCSGSAKALATMKPRSSTQSHPTILELPIILGITCQVEAAGKNFFSVINSINAIGRKTVSGSDRDFMYSSMTSLDSHEGTPVFL